MALLPYFKWYPADAETDEFYTSLTDQERGFYHRCLNRSWINSGLPMDLDELSKSLGVSRKYLDRIWEKVGQRFESNGCVKPRLVNPRQEKERESATLKSFKAATSVSKRKDRSCNEGYTNVPTNDPLRALTRAESESEYCVEFSSGGMQGGWKADGEYSRFVVDYLATGAALIDSDFAAGYACWSELAMGEKLERVAALNRHAEEYHADPRYVPKPLKFLREEWERPVRPKPANGKNNKGIDWSKM